MAQMTSATGSLPLRLSKGETLVIKDLAGSHTVTGSLAPREDASASVGAGFVVYGPQSSAVTVTISTTGAVDYQVVSGDVTPASPASGGGAVVAAVSAICESYARSKDRNPRTNATIRSCELVGDTIYADSAALQAAFPAASNANKGGKVGTASSYVIQVSNGTAWATPTEGVVGYLRASVSTTGYAAAVNFLPAGTLNGLVPPASGGAQLTKPFRMYGGMPFSNSGLQGMSAYNAAGGRGQSATGRVLVSTDEPEPIFRGTGFGTVYFLLVDLQDGSGPRAVVDPAISAPPYSNVSFLGGASGGIQPVKLDVSQLGGFGRRKRELIFPVPWDVTITDFRIKPVSSYFQPPESPRVVFITDSMGFTVYQGDQKDGYVAVAQDFMGVHDTILVGEGGTGFVNTNGANRNHLAKLQNLTQIPQYANPDVIVLQSSANDNNLSGISDAVEACLRFALDTWPKTVFVVTGATSRNSAPEQANSITTENLVKAGIDRVASSRVVWVPMMTDTPQFIRGTGAVNALTSDGNADLMFNTGDTIHWVTPGHLIAGRDYFAPKIAAALRAWVEAQT